MNKRVAIVPQISCGGCEHTIQTNLSALPGVTFVKADRRDKTVRVEFDDTTDWATIAAKLVEIDYPPESVSTPA
jgi:copper chaperone CopZ